jgi:ferredoxin
MTELGDTRARVDHDLCAGVAECLRQAPGAFLLDDDGMSVFAPSAPWTPGQLAVARDSCPTQAITILPDGAGPAGDTASGAAGER